MMNVDRRGGREGKKSLRVGKKAQLEAIKQKETEDKNSRLITRPLYSVVSPCIIKNTNVKVGYIDCCFQGLNRMFEKDQLTVFNRAYDMGSEAMVIYSPDFGKTKEMIELCKQWNGFIYTILGVHSDTIKRVQNINQFSSQMEELHDYALLPEVVAIYTGLDFSRDISTLFLQEKLFYAHLELAAKIHLPLIVELTTTQAADKYIEKMNEALVSANEDLKNIRLCVKLNRPEKSDSIMKLIELGCYFLVDAQFTFKPIIKSDSAEENDEIKDDNKSPNPLFWAEFIPFIPMNRLLLMSNSPYYTPQNIEDTWVRDSRNEPSNLSYNVKALAKLLNKADKDLNTILDQNARTFYGLKYEEDEDDEKLIETIEKVTLKSNPVEESKKKSKKSKTKKHDSDTEEEQVVVKSDDSENELPIAKKNKKKSKSSKKKQDSDSEDEEKVAIKSESEADVSTKKSKKKSKSSKKKQESDSEEEEEVVAIKSDSESDAAVVSKKGKKKSKASKKKYFSDDEEDIDPIKEKLAVLSDSDNILTASKKKKKSKGERTLPPVNIPKPAVIKVETPVSDELDNFENEEFFSLPTKPVGKAAHIITRPVGGKLEESLRALQLEQIENERKAQEDQDNFEREISEQKRLRKEGRKLKDTGNKSANFSNFRNKDYSQKTKKATKADE